MIILTALLVLAQQAKAAADERRPEEFEQVRTRTGYTLAQNRFEGDAVVTLLSFDDFEDNDIDIDVRSLRLEATYGILPWLQGEIELPFLEVDPDPGSREAGFGDIALEGKASLQEKISPFGFVPFPVAAGIRLTLPTGDEDEGLGEEKATFGLFASTSFRLEPWVALHGDIFVEFQSGERPIHGINFAADFTPWQPNISLIAALNYRRPGTEDPGVSFVPGFEYRFPGNKPSMNIGAGLPIGLTDDSEDWGLILNFQIGI